MTLAAMLALLTSALFGASDFLAGAMSRRLPGPAVALWSQLAGGVALLVLVALSGQGFSSPGAAWGASSGIIAPVGVLLFYRALSLGYTSIVTSMTAPDPAAYGARVAGMLLPDVLPYATREPAGYGLTGRNGRAMADDVYDVMVSLVANAPLGDGVGSDGSYLAGFPYLAPPNDLTPDLPPLVPREAG